MKVEKYVTETNLKRINKLIIEYQTVRKGLLPYVPEVNIDFKESELPFKTVHVGDTHFAHEHADPYALGRAIKETGKDGLLVSHANLFDSTSPAFTRNNTTRIAFDTEQQKRIVHEILRPINKRRRFVAISKNGCHEGWGDRFGFQDPTLDIVPKNAPVLITGGQIKFVGETGEVEGNVEVYHNPGPGSTRQSPEGALRVHSREVPDGHPDKANALGQGHLHRLFAGQDVRKNPVTCKNSKITLFGVGSAKGSKENPDDFLVSKIGVPPRNQPADAGEGMVLIWTKDQNNLNKISPYPVATYERAKVVFEAISLIDSCEKRGVTKELEEKISQSKYGAVPKAIYDKENSHTIKPNINDTSVGNVEIHDRLSHTIETCLPISVSFVGGLRLGCSTYNDIGYRQVVDDIASDPFSFWYATRRLLNPGISKYIQREEILEELVDKLAIAQPNLLGVMMTDEFRRSSWKRSIKSEGGGVDPLNPGDYLSDRLEVPLMMPKTINNIHLFDSNSLKKVNYLIYQTDKESHFTSLLNPQHGLTRIHESLGTSADLYVGGHTEEIGWRTWMLPNGQQLETLVPGGFSGFIEKGPDNEMPYPKGGQGVVIFPNQRRIFSFASHNDLKDYHRALKLHEGLRLLGILKNITRRIKK